MGCFTVPIIQKTNRNNWLFDSENKIKFVRFAEINLLFPFDERLDHLWIGERGDVADLVGLVFGDLAQDATHDFPAARLRQAGRELNFIRHGKSQMRRGPGL